MRVGGGFDKLARRQVEAASHRVKGPQDACLAHPCARRQNGNVVLCQLALEGGICRLLCDAQCDDAVLHLIPSAAQSTVVHPYLTLSLAVIVPAARKSPRRNRPCKSRASAGSVIASPDAAGVSRSGAERIRMQIGRGIGGVIVA